MTAAAVGYVLGSYLGVTVTHFQATLSATLLAAGVTLARTRYH